MNSKNTLLILGAFLLLAGSASALSIDSSLTVRDHSGTSLLSHQSPVSSGPVVIEVDPFKPNLSPVFENSTLSTQLLNGSSRGSGLSSSELARVLMTSRVYDPITKKWSKKAWTPSQRENIVMSWTFKGDRLGVKRPSAGRLYYNKQE